MTEAHRSGTPGAESEAGARRRPDPIWRLLAKGELLREHRDAALEIREAVAYITGPVAIRVSNPLRMPGRQPPGERHGERLARLKRRYLDWIDELGRRSLPSWPAFDVVIDEISCRNADRRRHKRNGTTKRLLVAVLDAYCELAGWYVARDEAAE